MIERVDKSHNTYCCNLPSRFVWQALPDVPLPVCRDCKRWLETLHSLGVPLV